MTRQFGWINRVIEDENANRPSQFGWINGLPEDEIANYQRMKLQMNDNFGGINRGRSFQRK